MAIFQCFVAQVPPQRVTLSQGAPAASSAVMRFGEEEDGKVVGCFIDRTVGKRPTVVVATEGRVTNYNPQTGAGAHFGVVVDKPQELSPCMYTLDLLTSPLHVQAMFESKLCRRLGALFAAYQLQARC